MHSRLDTHILVFGCRITNLYIPIPTGHSHPTSSFPSINAPLNSVKRMHLYMHKHDRETMPLIRARSICTAHIEADSDRLVRSLSALLGCLIVGRWHPQPSFLALWRGTLVPSGTLFPTGPPTHRPPMLH